MTLTGESWEDQRRARFYKHICHDSDRRKLGGPIHCCVSQRQVTRYGLTHRQALAAVNYYDSSVENDGILVQNNGILIKNDGILVANDGILVENNGILVTNDGILVANDGILVANDGILVKNDNSLVKNNDSLVENDDSLVENGRAPRYLRSCTLKAHFIKSTTQIFSLEY